MIITALVILAIGVLIAIIGTFLYFMFDDKKASIGVVFQFAGVVAIVISIIIFLACALVLL